jgi:hypothetical protein
MLTEAEQIELLKLDLKLIAQVLELPEGYSLLTHAKNIMAHRGEKIVYIKEGATRHVWDCDDCPLVRCFKEIFKEKNK